MKLVTSTTSDTRSPAQSASGAVLCCVQDVGDVEGIVDVGARLAAAWDAPLALALVDPVPVIAAQADVAYASGIDADDDLVARQELLRQAAETAGAGAADLELTIGRFDTAVETLADRHDARAIVLPRGNVVRERRSWLPRPASTRAAELRRPLVVVPPSTTAGGGPTPTPIASSIVCGADSSEDARAALRLAGGLADALALRLVVVQVPQLHSACMLPPAGLAPPMVGDTAERLDRARAALRSLVDREGLAAEVRVESGFPAEVIADLADQEDAELIVVGSRGHGAFRATFLGSVSDQLIRIARRPVLVVPHGVGA